MTPYYEQDGIVIYHGDCREVEAWLSAGVLVTDPPYGIDLESGMGGRHDGCEIANDHSTELRDFVLVVWGDKPAMIFGSPKAQRPPTLTAHLIWDKGEHVGMGDLSLPWKPNWEEVYVIGRGFAGYRRGSVLRHLAIAGCVGHRTWRFHPTEKPESLMIDLLSCCPPTVVSDPFMGSGTTLVAAKRLGRKAIGVEIEERHCEIAAKRLAQGALPLEMDEAKDSERRRIC